MTLSVGVFFVLFSVLFFNVILVLFFNAIPQ